MATKSKSGSSRSRSTGSKGRAASAKSRSGGSSTRAMSARSNKASGNGGRSSSRAGRSSGGRSSAGRVSSRGSSSSRSSSGRSSSSRGSQTTTDHDQIRQWAEERGAHPACVKGTGGKGDAGVLRLDFPGYTGADSLQEISWDEFFEKFEDQKLALLYQDTTKGGQKSNFNKLVKRSRSGRNPGQTQRRSGKR